MPIAHLVILSFDGPRVFCIMSISFDCVQIRLPDIEFPYARFQMYIANEVTSLGRPNPRLVKVISAERVEEMTFVVTLVNESSDKDIMKTLLLDCPERCSLRLALDGRFGGIKVHEAVLKSLRMERSSASTE